MNQLFRGYDRSVRPRYNSSETVEVLVRFSLQQLNDLVSDRIYITCPPPVGLVADIGIMLFDHQSVHQSINFSVWSWYLPKIYLDSFHPANTARIEREGNCACWGLMNFGLPSTHNCQRIVRFLYFLYMYFDLHTVHSSSLLVTLHFQNISINFRYLTQEESPNVLHVSFGATFTLAYFLHNPMSKSI